VDEFQRIARLAARFGTPPRGALGIGDDCAVLESTGRATALTVDASVEGVHFSRDIIALDLAAERAVEAALSDVAAMGGSVRFGDRGGCGVLCAWTVPPRLDDWDFEALVEGTARAAQRAGAFVLGGNLAAAPVITLTTTVVGRIDGPTLTRSGARVGDKVCVTGVLGAAALGLRALGAHLADEPLFRPFVQAWRSPRARLAEGAHIATFASAAIDVSDGCAQDVGHLAQASGVGVVIDVESLPMLADQRTCAERLGVDPLDLALAGGEDYELVFTAREVPAPPEGSVGWTVIGEVVAERGVFVRDASGTRKLDAKGWDHFR
jgi:thiamine-monophosphate kinase